MDSPVSLARAAASPEAAASGTPQSSQSVRTKASSRSDSAPRSRWLKCAADTVTPSASRSEHRICSIATESAPPDTAQTTVWPGESMAFSRHQRSTLSLMLPLQIRERRKLREPLQLDRAGLAVAIFRDDALGDVFLLRVFVVIVVAVDEHDRVGVLLDGAGFAQVGEHGPLVRARFVRTGQLAQADDRDVQLFGHDLQRAGNFADDGDAILARFTGGRGGHQLKIVDDNETKVVETAAFCVHLRNGDGRVVVDADVGLAQRGGCEGQLAPILLVELAGRELLVIMLCFSARLLLFHGIFFQLVRRQVLHLIMISHRLQE